MQKLIFSVLFILIQLNAFSQNDSIAKYMDDKGRSNFKNIRKTDVTQILQGNILFIKERELSGTWRLETGIGLLTSNFYTPLYNALYRDGKDVFDKKGLEYKKMNPGLSLYISPRETYIKYPSLYSSANVHLNYYFNQLLIFDVSITTGKEYNLSRKWILDINTGIGVSTHWSFDGYYYSHKLMIFNGKSISRHNNISLIFPISIKLGYRIN